jgi:hypothetical protein
MNNYRETFEKQGYVIVKNFISKDIAKYLFEYTKFLSHVLRDSPMKPENVIGDNLVKDSWGNKHGDIAFDVLMKMMKPKMEEITGLQLYPTYTYFRLYQSENIMPKHRDRPSCEISLTLKLSDTGNYNWPIFMANNRLELDDGDGVVYRGCELEHWREKCDGPKDYRLGQLFMHYVDKNGNLTDYKYDKRNIEKYFESEL